MSMRPIQFCLQLFDRFGGDEALAAKDQRRSEKVLMRLLDALVDVNVIWLQTHTNVPAFYTGVATGKPTLRYRREVDNEVWSDTPTVFKTGYADCEDLACVRAAELRKIALDARAAHGAGHDCDDCKLWAKPYISYRTLPGGGFLYHARTWRSSIKGHLPPGPTKTPNGRDIIVKNPDGDGYIEDPSLVLGMSWKPEAAAGMHELPERTPDQIVAAPSVMGSQRRGGGRSWWEE